MRITVRNTFIFSFLALTVILFSVIMGCSLIPRWFGILFGLGFALIAILSHFLGKIQKGFYLLSFFLNTVGTGLSISAYYSEKHIILDIHQMLFAVGFLLFLVLLLVLLLWNEPSFKKWILLIFSLVFALLMIACVVFWIIDGSVLFSFGFFATTTVLILLAMFSVSVDTSGSALRYASFGSFGWFIIITIIVSDILSESLDVLEIFDLPFWKKKKK